MDVDGELISLRRRVASIEAALPASTGATITLSPSDEVKQLFADLHDAVNLIAAEIADLTERVGQLEAIAAPGP